jgi:hypothetical protein
LWRLLNINSFIISARPLKTIFSLFWLYIWYHYVYIHNLLYGTYSPQFFLSHWRRTACTEFFSWFQCIQTVFKINTIIYRNKLFTDEFHYLKWIIKFIAIVYIYIMVSYILSEEWKYWF